MCDGDKGYILAQILHFSSPVLAKEIVSTEGKLSGGPSLSSLNPWFEDGVLDPGTVVIGREVVVVIPAMNWMAGFKGASTWKRRR